MIFEINYNELQVPLAMIKELLSDKDYKGDVKVITFEVTKEGVSLFLEDDRLGVCFKYDLLEAEAELPGIATCSFASFYETVKVFKKSEEALIIERDGFVLRVDDGQYPEELLTLKADRDVSHFPDNTLATAILTIESEGLRDGIQLASSILRKTDIPVGNVDTQAVYLGTGLGTATFTSFSLHNFHRSTCPAVVSFDDRILLLTKPVASAIAKLVDSAKNVVEDWLISEFPGDQRNEAGIVIQSEDERVFINFRLDPIAHEREIRETFESTAFNFKEAIKLGSVENVFEVERTLKAKTTDNACVKAGKLTLNETGYPAQLLLKLRDRAAWGENGKVFYVDSGIKDMPVMCLYDVDEWNEKITCLSYRKGLSA